MLLEFKSQEGGVIDEGNLIYLFDMGINSAQAQGFWKFMLILKWKTN